MAQISRAKLFRKLNPVAYKAIESATVFCKMRGNPYVELVHWIHQILQLSDSDLHRIVDHFAVEPGQLARDIMDALDKLPRGSTSISDLSSHVEEAVERGWVLGTLMFDEPQVRTGYLLAGMLSVKNLRVALESMSPEFRKLRYEKLTDDFKEIVRDSPENGLRTHDGLSTVDDLGTAGEATKRERVIFLNYRRSDSMHATGRIFDHLEAFFGMDSVFKDADSILLGTRDWTEEIRHRLSETKYFLAVIGPHWLDVRDESGNRRLDDEEDWVRVEIEAALQSDAQIIPILVDDAMMPKKVDLPESLWPLHRCVAKRIGGDLQFKRDLDDLIRHISRPG